MFELNGAFGEQHLIRDEQQSMHSSLYAHWPDHNNMYSDGTTEYFRVAGMTALDTRLETFWNILTVVAGGGGINLPNRCCCRFEEEHEERGPYSTELHSRRAALLPLVFDVAGCFVQLCSCGKGNNLQTQSVINIHFMGRKTIAEPFPLWPHGSPRIERGRGTQGYLVRLCWIEII